jgi:hypothetical protein
MKCQRGEEREKRGWRGSVVAGLKRVKMTAEKMSPKSARRTFGGDYN